MLYTYIWHFVCPLRMYVWMYLLLFSRVHGEGNGTPLQYSCLENPMDGGAWWAIVHGVAKSQTWLSNFTFTFYFSLSCTGEGNGNPLQCSCLENPRDGGDWWAAIYGVAQSQMRLKWLSNSSSSSCVQFFTVPETAACQTSLSFTNSQSLPKFVSIALVMPSSHLILWHPLLLLPSIFPSIRDFPNESVVHIRWPKCWSFSLSISPSNKGSGLISLKIDWFDLAVQGTLRSLLQHHTSKASLFQPSAFFTV